MTKASSLVDQAKKWAAHYGQYPNGTEGAVLSAPLRTRGAWESNDAEVLAAAFTENGSMLLGDEQLKGRDNIRTYLADAFAGKYKGSRIEDEPVDMFFLSPDSALVISLGGVVPPGETSLPADRASRVAWVVAREQGEWKVFSYQSSPIKG